jgi:hypothetical protein
MDEWFRIVGTQLTGGRPDRTLDDGWRPVDVATRRGSIGVPGPPACRPDPDTTGEEKSDG